MNNIHQFPKRLHGYGEIVAIRLPKHMGIDAKIFLRDIAKNQLKQIYHHPIETEISGSTDSGKEIPINTVGRWLFGTPGYMGHIRVSNWEDKDCKIEFPTDSPKIVKELISEIKKKVDSLTNKSSSQLTKDDVLEQAMRLAKKMKPDASVKKQAAFANSVQFLVTGSLDGYGGPSVREHAVNYLYGNKAGQYMFREAVDLLIQKDGPIFGSLTDIHRECWKNYDCFDDDPKDIKQLNLQKL